MWTRTRVSDSFGLRVPIVLGPLGGGFSTPALTAAVSNAGGLGSFGAIGMEPEDIGRTVAAIAALTRAPFAMNLWVPIPGQDDAVVTAEDFARSAAHVAGHYAELGLPVPAMAARF